MQTKLQEAKAYLRSRGKYIVDKDCKFKPTPHAATDVAKTIAAYKKDMVKLEQEKQEQAKTATPKVVRYFNRSKE